MLSSLEHLAIQAVLEHIAESVVQVPSMAIALVAPNSLPLPEQQGKLQPFVILLCCQNSTVSESGSCHVEPKLQVIFNEHVVARVYFDMS